MCRPLGAPTLPGGGVAWTRQFGTSDYEFASGIAIDEAGHVVVAGSTGGTLPGEVSVGDFDAFMRKYRPDGHAAWSQQLGTEYRDGADGVAADGTGRIAIAGTTDGTFPGQTNEGGYDAFLRVYVEP